MSLNRLKALLLLQQCTGADIWSVETCRANGVPEAWIDELCDGYESGYATDRDTIYYDDQKVNQFEGIHDLLLARKIAESLGVDRERMLPSSSREAEVQALQEAVEEL